MVNELGDAKITLVLDDAALRETLRGIRDETAKTRQDKKARVTNRREVREMVERSLTGGGMRRRRGPPEPRQRTAAERAAVVRAAQRRIRGPRSVFGRAVDSAALGGQNVARKGAGKFARGAMKAVRIAAGVKTLAELSKASAGLGAEPGATVALGFQWLQAKRNVIDSMVSSGQDALQFEATRNFATGQPHSQERYSANQQKLQRADEATRDMGSFIDNMVKFQGGGRLGAGIAWGTEHGSKTFDQAKKFGGTAWESYNDTFSYALEKWKQSSDTFR